MLAVLTLTRCRPLVAQISKRMLEICGREGLAMNQATMDALVQVLGVGGTAPGLGLRAPVCEGGQGYTWP